MPAAQVDWEWRAGDEETITFAWPGTLGDETYSCQIRAAPTLTADSGIDPLATATVDAEQETVSAIAVTVAVTAAQTRSVANAGHRTVAYDVVQTPTSGGPHTLFTGTITFVGDVTK